MAEHKSFDSMATSTTTEAEGGDGPWASHSIGTGGVAGPTIEPGDRVLMPRPRGRVEAPDEAAAAMPGDKVIVARKWVSADADDAGGGHGVGLGPDTSTSGGAGGEALAGAAAPAAGGGRGTDSSAGAGAAGADAGFAGLDEDEAFDGAGMLLMTSTVKLNDGRRMPRFGLGVYESTPGEETYNAVMWALEAGYRHVDTATCYGNEADVGRAIRDGCKRLHLEREEVWITTKLWNSDHGYDEALAACRHSLELLGLDYIDLYLIHSPVYGKRLETWRALEQLQREGKAKSIGVSNYGVHHLKELLGDKATTVVPAVNQIELHPFLARADIVAFCAEQGIALEAYAPLTRGKKFDHPTVARIASAYGKSPAQLLIRWSLQRGFICIPKSVNRARIEENGDVFDFEMREEDVEALRGLDEGLTTCWDPTIKD